MQVGKKYTYTHIYKVDGLCTCIFISPSGSALMLRPDGSEYIAPKHTHRWYKEHVEKKHGNVWINIYPEPECAVCHPTKKKADKYAGADRVACIEMSYEWYEGQGLGA